MEKNNLKPGKKYLHKRKTTISGRELEAALPIWKLMEDDEKHTTKDVEEQRKRIIEPLRL